MGARCTRGPGGTLCPLGTGGALRPSRSRRAGVALRPLRSRRTRLPGDPLWPLGSLRSLRPRRSGLSGDALRPLCSSWPLRPCRSRSSRIALRSLRTLRARRSLRPLRPLGTRGALRQRDLAPESGTAVRALRARPERIGRAVERHVTTQERCARNLNPSTANARFERIGRSHYRRFPGALRVASWRRAA